jgi:hypothetical protein
MNSDFFHQLPMLLVGIGTVIIFLAALELGYRAGLSRRGLWKGVDSSSGQHILTSMFALLGLILAFTYGAGVERFKAGKQAVILDATAMRTAFSHTNLVAEPERTELKQALLDYARTRTVKLGEPLPKEQLQELIQKSLQAQSKLRFITEKIAEQSQFGSTVTPLLVAAVDQVISVHTIRIATITDKLPILVILMLLFVASSSLSVAGFNAGISGQLNRFRMTTFLLVLTGVMLVIHDFDHPVNGFIHISHDSIINVINDMEANLAQ